MNRMNCLVRQVIFCKLHEYTYIYIEKNKIRKHTQRYLFFYRKKETFYRLTTKNKMIFHSKRKEKTNTQINN